MNKNLAKKGVDDMRTIDADKLLIDIRKNMTTGVFRAIELVNNQPVIEPTKNNKMYALGILADIMAQANYMITLEDGSQKLCVDTAIIDKIIDEIKIGIK